MCKETDIVMHRVNLLKTEVQKLQRLLENPQPGLFTWIQAVPVRVQAINDIMEGKKDNV
jgi:hypothetical protein